MSEEVANTSTDLERINESLQPSEAHQQAMALLRRAAMELDILIDDNADNLEGLARADVMVEVIKRDLATVLDKIHDRMGAIAPSYQFEIPGVGVYQKTKRGAKDVWDDEATMSAVVRRYMGANMVDAETGEQIADADPMDVVKEVARFGRIYWRKTPFKDAGIDLGDLVEKLDGMPSVRRLTSGER